MSKNARILVFDSGLGGLTVANALRELAPEAQLAYAADNAAFPYGDWQEGALVERMGYVLERLIAKTQPDVVVIACNTATTIGLGAMRQRFDVPFVGTVPAIKPAASITKSGHISVLATPGTVVREYTKALIDTYAFHCRVKLHGAEKLADIAEQKLRGEGVDLDVLSRQIAPVFVEDTNGRTDVVVLGCTHYPLLLEELKKVAPWEVSFIDPSRAIANQVIKIAETGNCNLNENWQFADCLILSAQVDISDPILTVVGSFGFDAELHHL